MQISCEIEGEGNKEVVLAFDRSGAEFLIKKLMHLLDHVDHEHLMTPSWSGYELTETPLDDKNELVHSLRIVRLEG